MPRAAQAQGAAGLHARGHAAHAPRERGARKEEVQLRQDLRILPQGRNLRGKGGRQRRQDALHLVFLLDEQQGRLLPQRGDGGGLHEQRRPAGRGVHNRARQVAPPLALQRQDQAAAALGDIPLHEPVRVRAQQGFELAAHPLLRGGALAAQGVQRGAGAVVHLAAAQAALHLVQQVWQRGEGEAVGRQRRRGRGHALQVELHPPAEGEKAAQVLQLLRREDDAQGEQGQRRLRPLQGAQRRGRGVQHPAGLVDLVGAQADLHQILERVQGEGALPRRARVREVRELLQDRVVFQHVQGRFHGDSPRFRFRKGGGTSRRGNPPGRK